MILPAGPDLTAAERQAVVRLLKRGDSTISGIRGQSMSAAGARSYIAALEARADEAERAQLAEGETDGKQEAV